MTKEVLFKIGKKRVEKNCRELCIYIYIYMCGGSEPINNDKYIRRRIGKLRKRKRLKKEPKGN